MQMSNSGVVNFAYGLGCAALRTHDLSLNFRVDEAEANEGCAAWFGKVMYTYRREGVLVAAAVEDRSLNAKGFRKEYVEENVYRLFMGQDDWKN